MDERPFKVEPGSKIKLKKFDTGGQDIFKNDEKAGLKQLKKHRKEIDRLQEILYASHQRRLLIVLQAMDTAGKDGTIRTVFKGVNPQGVKVASFKAPSSIELDHDYLWRIHQKTPAKGEIVVFNRSHYEDVLVVRVHQLVTDEVWQRRFKHINEFEQMLADEGTTILKFFLHIDLDTQRKRLLERIDIPEKHWKFDPNDLAERKRWPDYTTAYEEVLSETSTSWAPWYIIPSDHNWVRNLAVAGIINQTLAGMDLKYPTPVENIEQYRSELG